MVNWSALLTEQRNPATDAIDELDTLALVELINREDATVAPAVGRVLPAVAAAIDTVADALGAGGRLFYLGAGTSGRLGILDASECPPTFSVDPELVQGLIAGGERAVFRAVEGAEDDRQGAVAELQARQLRAVDVVFGIAASGVTPWVLGGIEFARAQGCPTVFFTCSPSAAAEAGADVTIAPEVGPEALTGSTRLKAGTATKMVLNMVTTGAMVRLGKTYGNLMVDLKATNSKLLVRSRRLVARLASTSEEEAETLLAACDGELKTAVVSRLKGVSPAEARQRLTAAAGQLRQALTAE